MVSFAFATPLGNSSLVSADYVIIYDINILTWAGFAFLAAIVYAYYGSSLARTFCTAVYAVRGREGLNRGTFFLPVYTVLLVLLFLARLILFVWRPATGIPVPAIPFRIWGYYVPETVPILMQLGMYLRKVRRLAHAAHMKLVGQKANSEKDKVGHSAGKGRHKQGRKNNSNSSQAIKNPLLSQTEVPGDGINGGGQKYHSTHVSRMGRRSSRDGDDSLSPGTLKTRIDQGPSEIIGKKESTTSNWDGEEGDSIKLTLSRTTSQSSMSGIWMA